MRPQPLVLRALGAAKEATFSRGGLLGENWPDRAVRLQTAVRLEGRSSYADLSAASGDAFALAAKGELPSYAASRPQKASFASALLARLGPSRN